MPTQESQEKFLTLFSACGNFVFICRFVYLYRADNALGILLSCYLCDTICSINLEFDGGLVMIGSIVKVIVDRPLGTFHPKYEEIYYSVNYGYIPNVMSPDGEEQDAYILGVNKPVDEFVGRVIAIIRRFDDIEEKWVVAPENVSFTKDEIMMQVAFQEQYFHTEICL